jgi:hypothetical protein
MSNYPPVIIGGVVILDGCGLTGRFVEEDVPSVAIEI